MINARLVCWVDNEFNTYSTIEICGAYYTFPGELQDPLNVAGNIYDRIMKWEEDGAQTSIEGDEVNSILYQRDLELHITVN
ncbi:MAG: hypothetical protein GY799_20940 [Desulfobulbaceae bacterium]|nr:hypothetical protein [Desulfobulbaceae bacterium]